MRYEELMQRRDAPPGSAWGVFGPDNELGTLARIGPAQVRAALASAQSGQVINLDYPLDAFMPPLNPNRVAAAHHIFGRHRDQRDDFVDGFYLQASSHLDGLRHRRHSRHGFYNGVPDDEVVEGSARLGIQRWAQSGIVARGVLLDVARHRMKAGRPFDYESVEPIDAHELDEVAEAQRLRLEPGDAVLVRTGWSEHYLGMSMAERARHVERIRSPGLVQARSTLAWLWDREVALLGGDNVAVEVVPVVAGSPFQSDTDGGLMHPEAIALLGLALAELLKLDELGDACAADGRYAFMFVARPLNLLGGVGSPANAIAIR